jgi:uncharacterized phosphatase
MQERNQINRSATFTTVYLVRHGQTDWNLDGRLQGLNDIELNKTGLQQAAQLAQYFKKQHWDVLISSPLKRAYKTAQIIAEPLSIPGIQVMDELIERDHGQSTGMTTEKRKLKFPDGVPGQETVEALQQRALFALNKIVDHYQGSRVLVVSHGELINAILFLVSKGRIGTGITKLGNGCISQVRLTDEHWIVDFAGTKMEELDFYLPCEAY